MQGKGLDGEAEWARGWEYAVLVVQDYGLGPGGLLVPSEDEERTC